MAKKRKPPNRQPRGPRATLPQPLTPEPGPPCGPNLYPEISLDPWWGHNNHMCACWHLHDECPCTRVDHMAAHLAAGCTC